MYPTGTKLEPGCVVDAVRGAPGEAVLTFRCGRDPRTYGIPIPLGDTGKDFYFPDNPVASIDEWLESVRVGMSIHVGTGLHTRGRRTLVGDYIELRETDGWSTTPGSTSTSSSPTNPSPGTGSSSWPRPASTRRRRSPAGTRAG